MRLLSGLEGWEVQIHRHHKKKHMESSNSTLNVYALKVEMEFKINRLDPFEASMSKNRKQLCCNTTVRLKFSYANRT